MPRTARLWPLALTVLECNGDGSGPHVPNIAGRWSYTELLSDDLHQITCADTGAYDLTQAGSTFVGSYVQVGTCRTPNGLLDNHTRGPVEGGRIVGLTIRFLVPPCCEYEGR